MVTWHKIVLELIELIKANHWEDHFTKATRHAHESHIPELADIQSLDDYLIWINNLLHWVPTENRAGNEIINSLQQVLFHLNQPPVLGLQNRSHRIQRQNP